MSERRYCLVGSIDGQPLRHALGEGPCLIGRAVDCTVQLGAFAVSRHHAEITVEGDRLRLRDLGSRNGTLLNGRRILEEVDLAPGDEIDLAGVVLRLVEMEEDRPETVVFAAPDAIRTSDELSWEESREAAAEGRERLSQLFPILAEAGELLARLVDPDELCEPIMDLVDRALSPDRIFLLMLEHEQAADQEAAPVEEGEAGITGEAGDRFQEPVIRASRLRDPDASDRIILSRTLLERVIRQQRSFLTGDAMADPLLRGQQSIVSMGIRSAMAVPLFDNHRVIGVLYADSSDAARSYTRDELRALTLLANVVAVAITNARHRAQEAEQRRLETELDTARRLLARILPAKAPGCPGYELNFHLEPCYEVAGDLYDLLPLPDGRLLVLVGDVSGKGLGAALMVVQILSLLRLLAEESLPPERMIERVNEQLCRTTDPDRFATLFLGILEPDSGRLVYVNGGHEPARLVRADGRAEELGGTGLLVGAFEEMSYRSEEARLDPGDLVLLYTDGVTDMCDVAESEYGLERLERGLLREHERPAREIVDLLLTDLNEHRGEAAPADDVTLLVLKRLATT